MPFLFHSLSQSNFFTPFFPLTDSCTAIFFSSIKINRQGRGSRKPGAGKPERKDWTEKADTRKSTTKSWKARGREAGNLGPGSQTAGTGKRAPGNRNGRAGRRTGPEKQKRRKRNGRGGTGCRLFRPPPPGAAPALRGRCGTATERGRSCAGKSGTDRRPPRNAAGRRYPPRRARCR